VTGTGLAALLLRRSASGPGAALWGRDAAPHFGPAFDRLLADGVLAERAPAAVWGPCRACDCALRARPIAEVGGKLVAECPEDANASLVLAPHEVRSFAIDVGALVAALARASGLAGAPEPLADGIWHLGTLADGRAVVLVLFQAAAADAGGLIAVLRGAVAPPATTLLLPTGVPPAALRRLRDVGCHLAAVVDALDGGELRLDRAALAPPTAGGARGARDPNLLVIDRMAVAATFGGVPLRLEPRDFRALTVLAREAGDGGAVALRDDLYKALVGREDLEAPIGDEQVDKSVSRIRAALCRAAGLRRGAGRTLVVGVRKHGYRLAAPPVRVHFA
jgi:hypothetical protein